MTLKCRYTNEAGVRSLSRCLAALCRHTAVSIVNQASHIYGRRSVSFFILVQSALPSCFSRSSHTLICSFSYHLLFSLQRDTAAALNALPLSHTVQPNLPSHSEDASVVSAALSSPHVLSRTRPRDSAATSAVHRREEGAHLQQPPLPALQSSDHDSLAALSEAPLPFHNRAPLAQQQKQQQHHHQQPLLSTSLENREADHFPYPPDLLSQVCTALLPLSVYCPCLCNALVCALHSFIICACLKLDMA